MHSRAFRFMLLLILITSPLLAGGPKPTHIGDPDFRVVVSKAKEKVFPAVVFIKCIRETHERGKKQATEIAGSGVLISAEGELLTNWHVVDKAKSVRCLLYDGRHFEAEVVGKDRDLDLALVRLKQPEGSPPLPFAEIGESSHLQEGDFVMAMGAPWGLARSVSIGIISCTSRFLVGASEYSLWLQSDCAISPGNSGGPLIDTDGKIVGITARGMIYGGDMGFAVPGTVVREILPRFRHDGDVEWSWTGLELQPINDFNRDVYFGGTNGVIVASPEENSPAKEAGIESQDRILSIGGKITLGMTEEDLPDIRRMIALLPTEKPVTVRLMRDEEEMSVELTPRKKGTVEGDEQDCPRWDLTVKAINQFDNPDLYFYRKEGVFIYGIKYPGNASTARLGQRDIILKVDDKPINTLEDLQAAYQESIDNIDTSTRVLLTVLRNGSMRQAILDFSRDYERE